MWTPPTVTERFWAKVIKDDDGGCWLWTAATWGGGYGMFFTQQSGKRKLYACAHRFAYELLVGPIPEGLDIDHLCRVRLCVNPAHLEPVTRRTNTLRGIGPAAVNATKTHCPQGHPYDGENLYLTSAGYRQCRECNRRSCQRIRDAAMARKSSIQVDHPTVTMARLDAG